VHVKYKTSFDNGNCIARDALNVSILSKYMREALHPIQVVVARTGLTAHVIRIWEKRYGAVTPERTPTNRRLYSEAQIERLTLLRRLAEAGHGIGFVAKLPTDRLKKLVGEGTAVPAQVARKDETGGEAAALERALDAIRALDAAGLEQVLTEAEVGMGGQGVLRRLIGPLVHALGDEWRAGNITAAHEHFATAVVRLFLGRAARPFAGVQDAPVLIVVTPAGQLHELGALLVAAAAANLGWRVIYLGSALGAADIAGAARQHHARAIALSIVYPADDPNLPGELVRLRGLLPDTAIVAGGRAMPAYRETLEKIAALQSQDLGNLGSILDGLRQSAAPSAR
jgi:DNA-binding transcriptional MerR regulator/methylmalonyl-CoA mutase cobalamin-binding subunit